MIFGQKCTVFSSGLHAFHTYMNHSVVVVHFGAVDEPVFSISRVISIDKSPRSTFFFSICEKLFSSLCASVFQKRLIEWKNVHKESLHVHQIS